MSAANIWYGSEWEEKTRSIESRSAQSRRSTSLSSDFCRRLLHSQRRFFRHLFFIFNISYILCSLSFSRRQISKRSPLMNRGGGWLSLHSAPYLAPVVCFLQRENLCDVLGGSTLKCLRGWKWQYHERQVVTVQEEERTLSQCSHFELPALLFWVKRWSSWSSGHVEVGFTHPRSLVQDR